MNLPPHGLLLRTRVLRFGAAVFLAFAASTNAHAQQVELRFAHWLPPTHPLQTTGIEPWAKSIAEASKGSIKITTFPAEQLGSARDHYDMARDGIADISFIGPGYQPGRFPVIASAELPFLFDNATTGSAALDQWYRNYASREMRDIKVCLVHVHHPSALHAKKAITRPEQLRGVRVRPAHATMARFMTLLGASSVQVTAPESRDALVRGIADAITFPSGALMLFKIHEAVPFHMDAPLYVSVFAWGINQRRYDGLTNEQKRVIGNHCNSEWAEKVATGWANFDRDGHEKLRTMPGHTVYPISADDLTAWRKAAAPLEQSWKEDVKRLGVDGDKALSELRATLEKLGAHTRHR